MRKLKKIIATVLAATMMMAMGVTAFAAEQIEDGDYSASVTLYKEADIWQFLVHWAGCFISKCEEELVHDEKSNSNYFIYGISNIAFCMWQKRRTVRDS